MTNVQLNQKEQHWAKSREKAEEIVSVAKENDALTMHKISEKFNKNGFYFLVDLQYTFSTPKEVMESRPQDDAPEGQMSIDEGVEYTVEKDGSITVPEGQSSVDEVVEDIPEDEEVSEPLPFEDDGAPF